MGLILHVQMVKINHLANALNVNVCICEGVQWYSLSQAKMGCNWFLGHWKIPWYYHHNFEMPSIPDMYYSNNIYKKQNTNATVMGWY